MALDSTTSKAERLQEYLDVETLPDLTAEEVEEIQTEGSKVHHRVFVRIDFPLSPISTCTNEPSCRIDEMD